MCGRFALTTNASTLSVQFDTNVHITLTPRFNIAPSQKILVIRVHPQQQTKQQTQQQTQQQKRESASLQWGLIPSWADDPSIGARLTNARAETAATKPSFRDSFRRRRCLIPAHGFYEWTTSEKRKQPYFIRLISNKPFGIGGLWDSWEDNGERIETCTILTCAANQAMQHLHQRMPVVIQPDRYNAWLSPATELTDLSQDLLPFSDETTAISQVSDYVNDVRHDSIRCQTPYSDSNQAKVMHNAQLPTASQKLLFQK